MPKKVLIKEELKPDACLLAPYQRTKNLPPLVPFARPQQNPAPPSSSSRSGSSRTTRSSRPRPPPPRPSAGTRYGPSWSPGIDPPKSVAVQRRTPPVPSRPLPSQSSAVWTLRGGPQSRTPAPDRGRRRCRTHWPPAPSALISARTVARSSWWQRWWNHWRPDLEKGERWEKLLEQGCELRHVDAFEISLKTSF